LPPSEHESWPPFVMPWDDATEGPTDMSHLLHKPAGSRGFIRIANGHLATGDAERWRIWGQNVCFGAALPPVDKAPGVARRLAKFGINCIRFHHADHRWPTGFLMRSLHLAGQEGPEPTRALDPEAMARLDYFIYCLAQNGVYSDLNLNVSRHFTPADGVEQSEWLGYAKAVTYFDPQVLMLQKEYAQQLLRHVNPFTGNRYAEEPAVALVELVNENSIVESWLAGRLLGKQTEPGGTWCDIPSYYAEQLDRLWNGWLTERHGDAASLREAWGGDLRGDEDTAEGSVRRLKPGEFADASAARFHDEATFYEQIEQRFFDEMAAFLREEVGVRQIIVGSSDHNHYINNQIHVSSNARLGIIDGHCYWQHPRFTTPKGWGGDWLITNTPMVDNPDHSIIAQLSRSTVAGLPYIVTEVNEPFPNDYACEFIPVLAAYGLLQDWDGLFLFAYASGGYYEPGRGADDSPDGGPVRSFFSMANDPMKMVQTAAGALVFLRGDVRAAERMVKRELTRERLLEALREKPTDEFPYAVPGLAGRLALVHRTAIGSFDAPAVSPQRGECELPAGRIASDTGELVWTESGGRDSVLMGAPCCEAVIGHAGRHEAAHLAADLRTPFASIQLHSLDGEPIASSERMLLVAAGRVANTGMVWKGEDRQSLEGGFGNAPARIEPVDAGIELRGLNAAGTIALIPLDVRGQPTGTALPFSRKGERWTIDLPVDAGTIWYLVEPERDCDAPELGRKTGDTAEGTPRPGRGLGVAPI
jgi:hypothetical protein